MEDRLGRTKYGLSSQKQILLHESSLAYGRTIQLSYITRKNNFSCNEHKVIYGGFSEKGLTHFRNKKKNWRQVDLSIDSVVCGILSAFSICLLSYDHKMVSATPNIVPTFQQFIYYQS